MPPPSHDDVRMRGFHRRIPLGQALKAALGAVAPLGTAEEVGLREALGRFPAADVRAPRAVPGFDRAAMDGYAVRGEATFPATAYDPVLLDVVGESLPDAPFEGSVGARQAVRIMTGAPMPAGADGVVPAEFAEESRGLLRVSGPVAPGRNVGRAGEDLEEGAVAVPGSRALRPQDLGVLASLGLARLAVAPAPRVALLATGNEIVKAGAELGPFQVYDADTPMLAALVERWGGRVATQSLQPDEEPRIRRAATRMAVSPGVDLVLITGGTSVGREDHAPAMLADAGRLVFHGVALRPASPTAFGVLEGRPVFLLPGNPVACLCAFDLLVGPTLRRLQGLPPSPPYPVVTLPLARRLASEAGRTDYARVEVTAGGVVPVAVSGASILSSASRAHGYVVVPHDVEGWDAGERVEVHLYGAVG